MKKVSEKNKDNNNLPFTIKSLIKKNKAKVYTGRGKRVSKLKITTKDLVLRIKELFNSRMPVLYKNFEIVPLRGSHIKSLERIILSLRENEFYKQDDNVVDFFNYLMEYWNSFVESAYRHTRFDIHMPNIFFIEYKLQSLVTMYNFHRNGIRTETSLERDAWELIRAGYCPVEAAVKMAEVVARKEVSVLRDRYNSAISVSMANQKANNKVWVDSLVSHPFEVFSRIIDSAENEYAVLVTTFFDFLKKTYLSTDENELIGIFADRAKRRSNLITDFLSAVSQYGIMINAILDETMETPLKRFSSEGVTQIMDKVKKLNVEHERRVKDLLEILANE